MARVFISYRREDTAGYAGWLNQILSQHLGQHHIFRDIDSIEPGLDFVKIIEQEVGTCEVLIALIGKHWLNAPDSTGRRRLDNPDDYVRNEITTALNRNVRVIPVLVQGAAMPQTHELPAGLSGLSRRNALELRDASWQTDVDRLIKVLERVLGGSQQAPSLQNISSPPPATTGGASQPKQIHAFPGQANVADSTRTPNVSPIAQPRRTRITVGLIGTAGLVILAGMLFFILRPLISIGFVDRTIPTSVASNAPDSGIPTRNSTATTSTEAAVLATNTSEIPRATSPTRATPTPTMPPGYQLLQRDILDGTFDPKSNAGAQLKLTAGRQFKFVQEWYDRYCRADFPPDGLVWVPCEVIGQPDATPIPTPTPKPAPTATPVPSKARSETWTLVEKHVSSDPCSGGHTTTVTVPIILKFDTKGDLLTFSQFDRVYNMERIDDISYKGVDALAQGLTDTIHINFTSPRTFTGDRLREAVQASQTCKAYYSWEGTLQ